jgi:hypothetical protein
MPYLTYKLIHLVGVFILMVALAGMAGHAASGQNKGGNAAYRFLLILHGVGALVTLVGGFGLLARIEALQGGLFPGWIWAKLLVWLTLGGMIALPYRNRGVARLLFLVLPLLGLLGGYLANVKPF